jgi:hypothetical protein
MINPINGHVLIEPLKHQTYLPTEKGTYEEVGIVLKRPWYKFWYPNEGDKVYYDSWLATKHPIGEDDSYFWLVPFKDIHAVEKKEKDGEK